MEFEIVYWHWLVLGMLLMAIEIVLPSFTALWFGVGAIIVGILMLFIPMSLSVQVVVWALVSAAFTAWWFMYLKPKSPDRTQAGLSREAILGQVGLVIALPEGEKRGTMRFTTPVLGADEWPFICETEVGLGDRVRVKEVSGNTLVVASAT